MYYMKISKTFRLSEEAIEVLNNQQNQSKFLEDLILERTRTGSTGILTMSQLNDLLEEQTSTLLEAMGGMPKSQEKQYSSVPTKINIPEVVSGAQFVPKPPDPVTGYPCCQGRSPCKHWVWDESETLWTNSLTGATRDE